MRTRTLPRRTSARPTGEPVDFCLLPGALTELVLSSWMVTELQCRQSTCGCLQRSYPSFADPCAHVRRGCVPGSRNKTSRFAGLGAWVREWESGGATEKWRGTTYPGSRGARARVAGQRIQVRGAAVAGSRGGKRPRAGAVGICQRTQTE